jgi:hypothetical protein
MRCCHSLPRHMAIPIAELTCTDGRPWTSSKTLEMYSNNTPNSHSNLESCSNDWSRSQRNYFYFWSHRVKQHRYQRCSSLLQTKEESHHHYRYCKLPLNSFLTFFKEHKCVLDSCRALEMEGFKVTYLPVQTNGLIDLEQLKKVITSNALHQIILGNHQGNSISKCHGCQ